MRYSMYLLYVYLEMLLYIICTMLLSFYSVSVSVYSVCVYFDAVYKVCLVSLLYHTVEAVSLSLYSFSIAYVKCPPSGCCWIPMAVKLMVLTGLNTRARNMDVRLGNKAWEEPLALRWLTIPQGIKSQSTLYSITLGQWWKSFCFGFQPVDGCSIIIFAC